MKRLHFIEEHIVGVLKDREAGMPTAEVCRKHGFSSFTSYKFKVLYGGLQVSDARKLEGIEDEVAKLKKLLAEAMLDNALLKDAAKKGDARRKVGGGGSSLHTARRERAAGM